MDTEDVQEVEGTRERLPARLADVEFEDDLEVLGLAVGASLVLVGLGTLALLPFTPTRSIAVGIVQAVGGLAAIGIGAGLAWLVQTQR